MRNTDKEQLKAICRVVERVLKKKVKLDWEEIEHTKLLDEDSEFIRNNIEKEKSFYEKRMAKEKEIKAKEEAERKKQAGVIEKLEALLVKEPMNWFYQSLKNQIGNRVLSDKQVWCVERDYQKKIVCA